MRKIEINFLSKISSQRKCKDIYFLKENKKISHQKMRDSTSEEEGFEPPDPWGQRFSRPSPSTTRTFLQSGS